MLLISYELRTAQQVSLARQNFWGLSRFDIKKIWSKLTTFREGGSLCWKDDELAHPSRRFIAGCGDPLPSPVWGGGDAECPAERGTSRQQPGAEKSRTRSSANVL